MRRSRSVSRLARLANWLAVPGVRERRDVGGYTADLRLWSSARRNLPYTTHPRRTVAPVRIFSDRLSRMEFRFTFEIEPAGVFGLPEDGVVVLPLGPGEYEGPWYHTSTMTKASHGTLPQYRSATDAINEPLELGSVTATLRDNYITLTVQADDRNTASAEATERLDLAPVAALREGSQRRSGPTIGAHQGHGAGQSRDVEGRTGKGRRAETRQGHQRPDAPDSHTTWHATEAHLTASQPPFPRGGAPALPYGDRGHRTRGAPPC